MLRAFDADGAEQRPRAVQGEQHDFLGKTSPAPGSGFAPGGRSGPGSRRRCVAGAGIGGRR
ncbi:hypothetical protein DY240_18895 [Jiangella rhizosphaerae]|uniref:Uncharacterized protein n=1 Tax=Jiangella rhizosphaerae TaxID=2293569 RepID=A0A418KMU1_9ACTN|nr:hypothetical protein DY240_18895 [Jiangella rhizosphaerae]